MNGPCSLALAASRAALQAAQEAIGLAQQMQPQINFDWRSPNRHDRDRHPEYPSKAAFPQRRPANVPHLRFSLNSCT